MLQIPIFQGLLSIVQKYDFGHSSVSVAKQISWSMHPIFPSKACTIRGCGLVFALCFLVFILLCAVCTQCELNTYGTDIIWLSFIKYIILQVILLLCKLWFDEAIVPGSSFFFSFFCFWDCLLQVIYLS